MIDCSVLRSLFSGSARRLVESNPIGTEGDLPHVGLGKFLYVMELNSSHHQQHLPSVTLHALLSGSSPGQGLLKPSSQIILEPHLQLAPATSLESCLSAFWFPEIAQIALWSHLVRPNITSSVQHGIHNTPRWELASQGNAWACS